MDQIIINNDTLSEGMGAEQPDAEIKKLTKKSFPVFFLFCLHITRKLEKNIDLFLFLQRSQAF